MNLGNRYVVFASQSGMPRSMDFDPETDSEILPRVADESDVAGHRIAETLKVSGFETVSSPTAHDDGWDVELIDDKGARIFVQIKVAERDLKQKDLDKYFEILSKASEKGKDVQVWNFNIEKLKLSILSNPNSPRIDTLGPLDVWERTETGVYPRSNIVRGVAEWADRVETLYDQVVEWSKGVANIQIEKIRTVVMSEELMQKYAVPDKELPILDIISHESPVLSFVPRGRWILGARGRIDIITQTATFMLVDQGDGEAASWKLVSSKNRRESEDFDAKAFANLLDPHEQANGY